MPTQFTATVKPSGGDYTSLNSAVTGLANDLTLATIKVFSISASTTPTIAAGDTVLGQTSLATGVCVLVNAARTQILIKTIAVASFLSGEIVQKTADANVNVTLSNTGDSPIIGIECYSMSDTTPVDISGYTTSSTNYIYIYTPISERHNGKWSPAKYSLEYSGGDSYINIINISTDNIIIDGLQLKHGLSIINGNYGSAIVIEGPKNDCNISISNTIISGNPYRQGIHINNNWGVWTGTNTIKIWNNIIHGYTGIVDTSSIGNGIYHAGGISFNLYVYNNTVLKCNRGIIGQYGILTLKNNISYNNNINYLGEFNINSTNNLSGPQLSEAPGLNPRNGPNMFVTFIDETNNDFHLASNDTGARNYGTDLSGDINLPFSTDIDGQTRPGQLIWDVGADEYFPIHNYGYILC